MILLAVLLFAVLIFLLLFSLLLKASPKAKQLVQRLKERLLNASIRFALQSNLKMQIAAATTLTLAANDAQGTSSALVTICVYNLAPVVFFATLYQQR